MRRQLVPGAVALRLPDAAGDAGNGGTDTIRRLGAHDVAMVRPAPSVSYIALAAGPPRLAANVTSSTGAPGPTRTVFAHRSTHTTRVARLRPGC
jgi:hypothetical protein